MKIQIVHEDSLTSLGARFPGVAHLAQRRPLSHAHWAWNDGHRMDANVLFLGKTGHGKSSLLNTISGGAHFATSDVEACTRDAASAEYAWPGQAAHHFSLIDMPGVGESRKRDTEYQQLYLNHCQKAGAVVWVLVADRRDYSVDMETLRWIFGTKMPAHLIFALNMVDRMPPIHRSSLALTPAQEANVQAKVIDCARFFGVDTARIVPVSAATGFGLNALMTTASHAVVYKSMH